MPATQTSSPRLDYDIVDVFTSRPFAGNPLAVVYGAEALTTAQMHLLAMEFNLSETTFPVPVSDADAAAGADYRVRIFTPGGEIPFAGHPTLGTAWALRERGLLAAGARRQACLAGLIGVEVPEEPSGPVALSAVPRDHALPVSEAETAELAALVGLAAGDVIGPGYFAGCGLTWAYLQVAPEAVDRARTVGVALSETSVDVSALRDPVDGVDVFALVGDGGADAGRVLDVSSRVFVPGFGIPEDPATGSAAAGLGLTLVASGTATGSGETAFLIEQGVAMGRPSRLECQVTAVDGSATIVRVAGGVVAVASGRIAVPEPAALRERSPGAVPTV
jgi:trans-2,3-dihydro-3-hydroxyanthranilate isomerase